MNYKTGIIYGTFDLYHVGHENILRRAKSLVDYLIVGVTDTDFDLARGKMDVYDTLDDRIQSIKNSGYADEIIIEKYVGQKIDDIKKYNVDAIFFGSDWVGKMDYLQDYCNVIYFPRTEGISSTMLRKNKLYE
jgi:glycerol-3-phosphate cytidylyltransferase